MNVTFEACETLGSEPDTKRLNCELEGGGAQDGRFRSGSAAISHRPAADDKELGELDDLTPHT